MLEIVLFSTGCPKCRILERKLEDKHISYKIVSDVDLMGNLGIQHVPMLKVGETMMDFSEAIRWVNECADEQGCVLVPVQ